MIRRLNSRLGLAPLSGVPERLALIGVLAAMILTPEVSLAQPIEIAPSAPEAAAPAPAAVPEAAVQLGGDPRPGDDPRQGDDRRQGGDPRQGDDRRPGGDRRQVPVNDPAAVTHGFLAAADRDGALSELAALDARRRTLELKARISAVEREIAENEASVAESAYKKRAADRDDPVAVPVGNQVVPVGRPPVPPGFDTGDGGLPGEPRPPGEGRLPGVPMADPLPPDALAMPAATRDSGPVVVRVTGRGGALSAVVQLPSGRVVTVRAGDALPDDLGRIESVTPTRVMLRPAPKDGAASTPADAKPLIFADELPNG